MSGLTVKLEKLNTIQEELKEAVSPADIKQLSQRSWLLCQRHADLKHKLAIRIQQLQSRAELMDIFKSHLDRLKDWQEKMETKLEGRDFTVTDLINQIENVYIPEILSREKELIGLNTIKDKIVEANWLEKEDVVEEARKAQLKYDNLKEIHKTKLDKLNKILAAQLKLETDLRELKLWLSDFENKISEPWKFAGVGLNEYKNNVKSLNEMERKLKQNSEKVNRTLNSGEIVVSEVDCGSRLQAGGLLNIEHDLAEVENRWKDLCTKVAEKKRLNEETWNQWQMFIEKYNTLQAWIEKQESLTPTDLTQLSLADCKDRQKQLDDTMRQLNGKLETLDELNTFYCQLAREGKLDEGGELKRMHSAINEEWERLSSETVNSIKRIAEKDDNFESFAALHEREMTWLRQIDAQLTEVQFSSGLDDEEKRRKLRELVQSVELRMTKIEEVKMMSSDVTEQCNSADWENIDRSVQALINLSSDVKQRLQKLLEELCVDDMNIHHQNIQVCNYNH